MAPHHDTRFPNEPKSYRVARDALLTAEINSVRGLKKSLSCAGLCRWAAP